MKAILISIKPKWCALMMNGDKTIEVRKENVGKAFQKLIDEYGFADVYVYCTKGKEKLYGCGLTDVDGEGGNIYFADKKEDLMEINETGFLNGKVLFKFRCYKVEEIKLNLAMRFFTKTLNEKELGDKTCLLGVEIFNYLKNKTGYAIHISELEIFDKPKELSEFETTKQQLVDIGQEQPILQNIKLTKAPESFCYIEVE